MPPSFPLFLMPLQVSTPEIWALTPGLEEAQIGQPGLASTRNLQALISTVTKFGSQTQTISLGIPDEFQQGPAVLRGFCKEGRFFQVTSLH